MIFPLSIKEKWSIIQVEKLEIVEAKIATQQIPPTDIKVAGIRTEQEDFELLRDRIIWCICHNLISEKPSYFSWSRYDNRVC